uniref:uncharacterized protein LOC124064997 n=1 Tax=Scatophagus argus TaxID=75038 RepID=UPI001ED802FC|nr:uncharacterized protein LOC124064997 [Scatophagus argus]
MGSALSWNKWPATQPGTIGEISKRVLSSSEEMQPSLIKKVETMASVIELLLETLADLSDKELWIFQVEFHIRHRDSVMLPREISDRQDVVFLMVQTYGQKAVEKTKEILKEMSRTDLVQRLSDSNSGPQKKLPVDEHLSALIHKVATLRAVKDLLLETLNDLSHEEQESFKWFLQFSLFQRSRPYISWRQLQRVDSGSNMVDVVVDVCGQQSVEVMKEVLMDMKRTDLVQRLSEASPRPKVVIRYVEAAGSSAEASGVNTEEGEKQSLDERWPALKQKVETMASVTELLLETLADLSDKELQIFKDVLRQFHIRHWDSVISDMLSLKTADKQNVVFLMVQTYGQKAVEKTKEVLKKMSRTDLVQRLSDSNSGSKKKLPVDEHLSALIHKVATVAAVKDLLLETLSDLSHEEQASFKSFIQFSLFQRSRPYISWRELQRVDSGSDMVDVMVDVCGQQSVEVMKEVLMDMKRTDLVQRLSEVSPGSKVVIRYVEAAGSSAEASGVNTEEGEKQSLDERWPALKQKVETMASVTELLLETLADLSDKELQIFKDVLRRFHIHGHKSRSPEMLSLETADKQKVVFLMVQTYGQKSVEKTKEVLKKMSRTDLVQRLSDSNSGPKKKLPVDEHLSALIHKVATVAAVKDLLLETLSDLSHEEQASFKSFIQLRFNQRSHPQISWRELQGVDSGSDMVDVVVDMCGQQSVEVMKEVLMDMKRTDLVQRLSEVSPGPKVVIKCVAAAGSSAEASGVNTEEGEKQSLDERWPALKQKVETMASVTELLLETLADLSDRELQIFKDVLCQFHIRHWDSVIPVMLPWETSDRQDIVFLMVQTYGQKAVEKTKEILNEMKRTDLVQRLSDSNSGPKKKLPVDEHLSALIHKVATVAAVKDLLLETLSDLSHEEQASFKSFIQLRFNQRSHPQISWRELQGVDSGSDMVDVVVDMCGQQSVEVMKEVLMDMKRTDLVQRLSEVSPGSKVVIKCVAAAGSSAEASGVNTEEGEKQSLDERWPALKQKVETMASVTELLLETLADLSDRELQIFKDVLCQFHIRHWDSVIPVMLPWETSDRQDIVFLMVQTYGQKAVEKTKEILNEMKRTDLVQRLSDSNSGPKKKLPVDEHLSALIHKVATLRAVKDLLLETLTDLSHEEQESFKWFLQFSLFQRSRPQISWRQLQRVDSGSDMVDVMVDMCGQQSVEVMKEVLMDMKRTDLVQRLSEVSPGSKAAGSSAEASGVNTEEGEKQSLDERWPALKQKVETMASVTELLLETLKDAATHEFWDALLFQTDLYRYFPNLPSFLLKVRDVQDMMFIMVLMYGQKSVEMINQVLKKLNKTDLVQKLSDSSSGLQRKKESSAGEHHSALIQRVATIAAVKEVLLETLNNLSIEELKKFKDLLRSIVSHKDLPDMPPSYMTDRAKVAFLMVQTYGQQSVWLTREVLMEMKLPALVQRLAMPSSGFQEKTSVGEHRAAPSESAKAVKNATVKKILLKTLSDLSHKGLEKFKWLLQFAYFQRSLPQIPLSLLYSTDRADLLVDLMVENQQAVEVTKEVLMDMNRTDLVQRLSESSPRPKGPSGSLEPEACGSVKDSSDWTKLEPEVSSTGADEAPTYSLQSEAGRFECSVSGLRWVCEAKISFKYQFCSWEEPMERMESLGYMPAGPLMDITVTTGKLDEVYLPHWIFTEDNPKISDKFAVLHIDDCGDVVEKVSEVTASHVKLSEPVFSPRAVLIKAGFPVKIISNVLIYQTNTAFLTLHIYLIPCDPGLQQAMDRKQLTCGYKVIQKPHPEKSLKMGDRFTLTADEDGAEICPEKLKLRYHNSPNFFEVFVENPNRNFGLRLTKEREVQPVWMCTIRKDDYKRTKDMTGEQFVDEHRCELIKRVSNIGPILDKLLRERVINQESYDINWAVPTTQEKMRTLYSGPLNAGGREAKDIFYKILEEEEPYLVAELKS